MLVTKLESSEADIKKTIGTLPIHDARYSVKTCFVPIGSLIIWFDPARFGTCGSFARSNLAPRNTCLTNLSLTTFFSKSALLEVKIAIVASASGSAWGF
jgi:hypothetical protein